MQHLQISGNLSSNDNFVPQILIHSVYNFTCLSDNARTLSQLYLLYTIYVVLSENSGHLNRAPERLSYALPPLDVASSVLCESVCQQL